MYKVVVAGGGCGGLTMANRMSRVVGAQNVSVVEPSAEHHYQPMWTLVGAGHKHIDQSHRPTQSLLFKGINWRQDNVAKFDPDNNCLILSNGDKVFCY